MARPHSRQDETPLRAYCQCDEDGIFVICPNVARTTSRPRRCQPCGNCFSTNPA